MVDTMEKWQTRALEAEAKLELNEAEMHRRLERQAKTYEAELQAVKDRASTSYREGYEARIAEEKRVGVVLVSEKPVLASNPLDPKCASIFEAAEMMADMSSAMRKMANALGEALESRRHYRQTAWDQDAEIVKLRAQLRDTQETADALKRQLGESQEYLHHALERAERAEKMLTTERRS